MEWEIQNTHPSITRHLLLGVLCSARRYRAGGNTRTCRSLHNKDNKGNNQPCSKPVLIYVEDQSNIILLSISENAAKVVLRSMILCKIHLMIRVLQQQSMSLQCRCPVKSLGTAVYNNQHWIYRE